MKKTFSVIVLGLLFSLSSEANADVIASNSFDSSTNLNSTTATFDLNTFTSAGDGWGLYDFNTGGPFALFDDTVVGSGGGSAFPTDSVGLAQSTKTDVFFGITDTINGDNGGDISVTFEFDISSAAGGLTSVDVDFAAMGDFETSDILNVDYSLDGGTFTSLFTSSVDTDGTKQYTMESGALIDWDDPMSMNGVELGNSFDTVSAAISGSGTTLALRFTTNTNGGTEAMGFDNIVINGIAVPEPSTGIILIGTLCGFAIRRRK